MKRPMHGGEKDLFHPKLSEILQLPLVKGVHLIHPLKGQSSSCKIDVCKVHFKSFDILVVIQFKP
jgi:hypothetical protein